jgi:ribosomal silencing factor RsfS
MKSVGKTKGHRGNRKGNKGCDGTSWTMPQTGQILVHILDKMHHADHQMKYFYETDHYVACIDRGFRQL